MSNREGDRRSEQLVTFKYEARVEVAPGEYVVLPDDHDDLAALLSDVPVPERVLRGEARRNSYKLYRMYNVR